MALEMSEAEVLAYPCDTIRFTEGWSVTTLEACAAGAIPVLRGVDALGEIYADLPYCMKPDDPKFVDYTVNALQDCAAENVKLDRDRGYRIAQRYTWPTLAEKLETIIHEATSPANNAAESLPAG